MRAAIYDAIRRDIIAGKLAPGGLIIIKELQTEYRVGLSAVREALCQLASDGLVSSEEQRGFRVAPISRKDLDGLTRARIDIEVFAVKDAVANGDTEWESQLVSAVYKLKRLPRPNLHYSDEHLKFHDLLVRPCTSEWMKRFRTTLHIHSDRYRRLAVRYNDSHRDIDAEHQALVDAVIAKDADLAAALITEHIVETERILMKLGFTGE